MLHLLLLALGGAFAVEFFNPIVNRAKLALIGCLLANVIIVLIYLYVKTYNGTSKKRNH